MIDFTKDYYQVLELKQNASEEEVKLAYRKLVKRYHPDLHPGNQEYEEKIKAINEAYEILGNADDRLIYDQYLKGIAEGPVPKHPYHSNKRTYTRKTVVDVEIRTYLKGTIFIKYYGEHIEENAENILRESFYKLNITRIDAKLKAEDIHQQQEPPAEFKKVFQEYKPIRLKIKQPVNCVVYLGNEVQYYQLEIIELTIPDPQIINVTKHEGESFGTLTGQFYGYIKKYEQHELVTEVTECFGETGRREERTENGANSYRKEYFNKDCTTYWGSWVSEIVRNTYEPTGNTETKGSYTRTQYRNTDKTKTWGNWVYKPSVRAAANGGCLGSVFGYGGGVLCILFFLFLLPKLVFILPFLLLPFLLNLLPVKFWNWFGKMFIGLVLGLYIFVFVLAIQQSKRDRKVHETAGIRKPRAVESRLVPVVGKKPKGQKQDTLITHKMSWEDYDGKTYTGRFWVSKHAFTLAHNYKNELPISINSEKGYDEVIYSLKEYDKEKLTGLYQMFDSLQTSNTPTPAKFAEMIVSFVQTIPYTIVLPNSCDSKLYQDEFTTQYLSSKDARCDGNERFGINTPVEFLASLNGDCDTRTLLLYTILDHYKYDVALLSSEHYSHSILGINLPYEGAVYNYKDQRYVFWETTALNAKPGILPSQISNADYWRISLKSR